MRKPIRNITLIIVAALLAGTAGAQVRTEKNISLQLAMDAAAEAVNACAKGNYYVTATVVDRAG
jgi:hypothetical protein